MDSPAQRLERVCSSCGRPLESGRCPDHPRLLGDEDDGLDPTRERDKLVGTQVGEYLHGSCSDESDCCHGECALGKCCLSRGQPCAVASDCCSATCTAGKCVVVF